MNPGLDTLQRAALKDCVSSRTGCFLLDIGWMPVIETATELGIVDV